MRILKVVVLLLVLGAIAGALTGAVFLFGLLLVRGHELFKEPRTYAAAATVGAIVGALSGPPLALLLLRNVPPWRPTIETAAAAGLGAAVGNITNVAHAWLYGAIGFALAAALRLRFVYRQRPAAAGAPLADE